MDILYILGKGSKHDNIELRMSLRSICKYGANIGRVIVAGYPCDWLSDEIIKVPIQDKFGRKHLNLVNCIQQVVDMGILDGEFLYSSDDHFYVKPTDFDNYPFFFKSENLRSTVVKGDRFYGYHLSLAQTRALLEKHHLPAINFEEHCNTHIHAQVLKDFKGLIDESLTLERGSPPTTLVMNAWITTNYAPQKIYKRADLKIKRAFSVQDVRLQIGEHECFSIGDSAFSGGGLMNFFTTEFPEKCRFEN